MRKEEIGSTKKYGTSGLASARQIVDDTGHRLFSPSTSSSKGTELLIVEARLA